MVVLRSALFSPSDVHETTSRPNVRTMARHFTPTSVLPSSVHATVDAAVPRRRWSLSAGGEPGPQRDYVGKGRWFGPIGGLPYDVPSMVDTMSPSLKSTVWNRSIAARNGPF